MRGACAFRDVRQGNLLCCPSQKASFLFDARRFALGAKKRCRFVTSAVKTADGPAIAIVGVTGAVGQEFLKVSNGSSFGLLLYRTITLSHPSYVVKVSLRTAGAQGERLPLQEPQVTRLCKASIPA